MQGDESMQWCQDGVEMAYFGEWVFELRTRARLSQEELGNAAKITKSYVSVIERNLPNPKTGALPNPRRGVVERIADALGAPREEALRAAGLAPLSENAPSEKLVSTHSLTGELQYMSEGALETLSPDQELAEAVYRLEQAEVGIQDARQIIARIIENRKQ